MLELTYSHIQTLFSVFLYQQINNMDTNGTERINEIGFSQPAKYEIRVQGTLSEYNTSILGNVQIRNLNKPGHKPVTVLEVTVSDQAALAGILNTLYEMHFVVISVSVLNQTGD